MALQVTAGFASGYHHDVYKIKKSFFFFFKVFEAFFLADNIFFSKK